MAAPFQAPEMHTVFGAFPGSESEADRNPESRPYLVSVANALRPRLLGVARGDAKEQYCEALMR